MPPPFRSTASTLSEPEYSAQAFTSIASGSRSLKLIWPQRRITAYHGFSFSCACDSPAEATITEAAETARKSRRVIESVLCGVTASAPLRVEALIRGQCHSADFHPRLLRQTFGGGRSFPAH